MKHGQLLQPVVSVHFLASTSVLVVGRVGTRAASRTSSISKTSSTSSTTVHKLGGARAGGIGAPEFTQTVE